MASDVALAQQSNQTAPIRLTRLDFGLPGEPEPPAGSLEAAMILLFGNVLDIDGIGAEDSFFALGGDSLAAATVMAGIERDLGVVLPVSTIIDASTPRALGQLIDNARNVETGSCVVPVRPNGQGPAVFCVHGIPGDVIYARTLALAMGPSRPVYGLRATGLYGGEKPTLGIANMAANYLAEIDSVKPHGPHLIFGYCGGALAAYEMAQQLHKSGRTPAGLVMVDPPVYPDLAPWFYQAGLSLQVRQWRSRLRGQRLKMMVTGGTRGETRRDRVRRAFIASLCAYTPEPYPGHMLVVHSQDRRDTLTDPAHGLPKYFGPHVEFVEAGPDHSSLFMTNVAAVGLAINDYLNRVAPV
jgi:acyl carrier protein